MKNSTITTTAENTDVTYWDGWSGTEYADLAAVQEALEGSGTDESPYIVEDADQLYAVIYYGGGDFVAVGNEGTYYKLANDLYLNLNYTDYANWDTNAPSNKWMDNDGSVNFNGTIDGNGHTIYGYYNSGNFTGLIPYYDTRENSTAYIKNLNMRYCASTGAMYRVGFIFAGTNGGGTGGNQVIIDNCIVRNGEMSGIYGSSCNGAIVGIAGRRTVINNCAVTDVVFNYVGSWGGSHPNNNTPAKAHSIGAIVGGAGSGGSQDEQAELAAKNCYITVTNSYSVNNIVNDASANSSYLVYPIGINQSWGWYYGKAVAQNLYTDSTTIPAYIYNNDTYDDDTDDVSVRLHITVPGGTAEVLSTDSGYPIKTVSANSIRGSVAKAAMPKLNWKLCWSTVKDDYPIPEDKITGNVWDGTKVETIAGVGMSGAGTKTDPYVITNGTQLYASIFSGGNGYYYVIANDIILNKDFENYSNWGTTAPDNSWKNSAAYDFYGHIDGQGYTIYGFYSKGANSGLIPSMNTKPLSDYVSLKNINISNSFITGGSNVGFIVGIASYKGGTRRIEISGCNVADSKIESIPDNAKAGGIVGAICNISHKINNCSVVNVQFTAGGDNTSFGGWSAMGAIAGSAFTGASYDGSYSFDAGTRVQITDCFTLNCIRTNDNKTLYPVGIAGENSSTYQRYYHSFSAENIYTDAHPVDDIPSVTTDKTKSGSKVTFSIKVSDVDDVSIAVEPTDDNYPIKQIAFDDIKGNDAKTTMSGLNWCHFNTVEESYPIWADNHTRTVLAAIEPTCVSTGLGEGIICSSCQEIVVRQDVISLTEHNWGSAWIEVQNGRQLKCTNCDKARFIVDVTVEGARLTTGEDVFDIETDISMIKIVSGTVYESALSALPVQPKIADIYNIEARLEGVCVSPNGNAVLSISIPEEWNCTEAVICMLTEDNKLRKLDTQISENTANATIATSGVYMLVDLSNSTFIGDINCDGISDYTDLSIIKNILLGFVSADSTSGSADTNIDGTTDIRDFVSVRNYIADTY